MRILMIAPEPFFEPRGTPFSEYHRIRALVELGHRVDLVTYPFGRNVDLPGLRIIRCARPPFVRRVRIGPSAAKVPLDLALAATALRCALRGRYDAVHSHEEGAVIGVLLARLLRVPHVYDMHSSLPQQLANFGYSRSRLLHALFEAIERLAVRRSGVVIAICPELAARVRAIDSAVPCVVIENAPGAGDGAAPGAGAAVRAALGVADGVPLVLYAGTFEPYQGLELLLEAVPHVLAACPEARFLLVGGGPQQAEAVRAAARAAGVDSALTVIDQQPAETIPAYLDAADVLVSPRRTGTNTPLKIYQYLRSGRPIVATRLVTHTQVLDDEMAVLTEPTGESFAAGIVRILREPDRGRARAERARRIAETRYSYEAYLARTREAYRWVCEPAPVPAAGSLA
ncbi:MAG TPA: glycosyltransferase family 4 protein [Vicinamibacterales bacterium]|nr:glycosyltransferase family 4 protein [Vicinamibacterales bacterium]